GDPGDPGDPGSPGDPGTPGGPGGNGTTGRAPVAAAPPVLQVGADAPDAADDQLPSTGAAGPSALALAALLIGVGVLLLRRRGPLES
ncbi:MAG TPA: LPXTG cell wall anchor domain-containing protein, partial [Actinotalea caeni]|uniref:LPXTG cell wall anchor domain-containing protein n=1 Tax=Actinotalea caeni TaxID=1348467 RepID=UPI002B4AC7B3